MKNAEKDSTEKRHPIQVVARRSGLTQDVLRAWENRYGLVTPGRSTGGRRLYSDADVERLRLTREAAAGGRRVGKLAPLSMDELRAMVEEDRREALAWSPADPTDAIGARSNALLAESLDAVNNLDSSRLKNTIHRATHTLAPTAFIDEVAVPLLHRVGSLWYEGRVSPVHEHLASIVMQSVLADLCAALQPPDNAPHTVVATPAGQRHEFGAMIVATVAEYEGWHVKYLGCDLPAQDIAQAAEQVDALAVALSVTYPLADPLVESELLELHRILPDGIRVLVGGQAAKSYAAILGAIGALHITDLADLRATLRELSGTMAGRE